MILSTGLQNMSPYECKFGSICRNPTILETVSFVSKLVNTDLTEKQNHLFLISREGKILSPMCICWGKMWKSNENNIFHIIFHVLS